MGLYVKQQRVTQHFVPPLLAVSARVISAARAANDPEYLLALDITPFMSDAGATRGLMQSASTGQLAYSMTPKVLRQAAESSMVKEFAHKLKHKNHALLERAQTLENSNESLQAQSDEAEGARRKMATELAVALAEVTRLEETLARADATIEEHRQEKASLHRRTAEAEALVATMRLSVNAADEGRASLQEKYLVARAERKLIDQQMQRLTSR